MYTDIIFEERVLEMCKECMAFISFPHCIHWFTKRNGGKLQHAICSYMRITQ